MIYMRFFEAVIDGRLAQTEIKWNDKAAVCVVMASGGYPQSYETGFEISGLPVEDALVFHAGTKLVEGKLVTAGGRVLGVTALGGGYWPGQGKSLCSRK